MERFRHFVEEKLLSDRVASKEIAAAIQPQWKQLWLLREPLLAQEKGSEPRKNNWKELNTNPITGRHDRAVAKVLIEEGSPAINITGRIEAGGQTGGFIPDTAGSISEHRWYSVDLLQVPFDQYPSNIQKANISTARIALKEARKAERDGLDLEALKGDHDWLAARAFEGHLNWLHQDAQLTQDTARRLQGQTYTPDIYTRVANKDQLFAAHISQRLHEGNEEETRILAAKSPEERRALREEYTAKAKKAYEAQDEYTKQMDIIFYTGSLEYVIQHPKRK